MFKVKRKRDNHIFQVLDVYCEPPHHITYFLIWENDGWRWRLADNFTPPNYNEDSNEKKG